MPNHVETNGLSVAEELYAFVRDEALPGTGIETDAFWAGAAGLIEEFSPRVHELLEIRDRMQQQIDEYHRAHGAAAADPEAYEEFLRSIGYLVEEPGDLAIETGRVDPEIATVSGPQLVVPLLNARFAANAANARWGSLYDALYGTDVVPETGGAERGASYNPVRGAEVIARARAFLDAHFPLASGSHVDARSYSVSGGAVVVELEDGSTGLADPQQYVGHRGDPARPDAVLLVHHGLHVEIQVDRADTIGRSDAAGVKDLLIEAAVSTIMDLEDSVAAVDAADKVDGYRNWLLLMRGSLTATVA